MRFLSVGLLAIAVAERVDAADRETAVLQMEQALIAPPGRRAEVFNQLAQYAATVLGAPTAVTAALPLLPLWQRHWWRVRIRMRPPRDEYHLTQAGQELAPAMLGLMRWGMRRAHP